MYLRTALRLGYPSVRALMDTGITSTELVEIAAMDLLDPPVGYRLDIGFAQVMALIYNRTRGKTEPSRRASDFMPRWGPPDHAAIEQKLRSSLQLMREVRQHGTD